MYSSHIETVYIGHVCRLVNISSARRGAGQALSTMITVASIGEHSAPGGVSAPDGYSASSDGLRLLFHPHPKA